MCEDLKMFKAIALLLLLCCVQANLLVQQKALEHIKKEKFFPDSIDSHQLIESLSPEVLANFPFCSVNITFPPEKPCSRSDRIFYAIKKEEGSSLVPHCLVLIAVPDNSSSLDDACADVVPNAWNTDSIVNFQDRVFCQSSSLATSALPSRPFELKDSCDALNNKHHGDEVCESVINSKPWIFIKGKFFFSDDASIQIKDDLNSRENYNCGSDQCNHDCLTSPCKGERSYCDKFSTCELSKSSCYCKYEPSKKGSLHSVIIEGQTYYPSCWGHSLVNMKVINHHKILEDTKDHFSNETVVCAKEGIIFSKDVEKIRVILIRKGSEIKSVPEIESPLFLPSSFRGRIEVTIYMQGKSKPLNLELNCPLIDHCYNAHSSKTSILDVSCRSLNIKNFSRNASVPVSVLSVLLALLIFSCLYVILRSRYLRIKGREMRAFCNSRRQKKEGNNYIDLESGNGVKSKKIGSGALNSPLAYLALLSTMKAKKVVALSLRVNDAPIKALDNFIHYVLFAICFLLVLCVISKILELVEKVKRNPRTSLIILILILLCFIPIVRSETEGCEEVTTMVVSSSDCEKNGESLSCSISSRVILSLSSTAKLACLTIKDSENIIEVLKIKVSHIQWNCVNDDLYYTFPAKIECKSQKLCPGSGKCVAHNCENYNGANPDLSIFPEFNGILSSRSCSASCGCWGCGCFQCSDGCMFMIASLKNPSQKSIRVSKCTGWKPQMTLQITSKTTTGKVNLHLGGRQKIGDISAEIVSMSHSPFVNSDCFLHSGDSIARAHCNAREQVTKGMIGEIQCKTSEAAEKSLESGCRFPKELVSFVSMDDDSTCNYELAPVLDIFKKNLLPIRDSSFLVTEEKGQIISKALDDFTVNLVLSMKEMKISTVSDSVDCAAVFENLEGCYNCKEGAKIKIKAHCKKSLTCFLDCADIKVLSSVVVKTNFDTVEIPFFSNAGKINSNCKLVCNSQVLTLAVKGTLSYSPTFKDWDSKGTSSNSFFSGETFEGIGNFFSDKIKMIKNLSIASVSIFIFFIVLFFLFKIYYCIFPSKYKIAKSM
uniref:Glycoprotein n=1 Tax=Shuangao Insect Virus 3 TaxID=1608077 RepID=A0A2C9NK00_9VIRU|nr:glycoprotein precursor [Shuangao Insect Virus 3]